MHSSINELKKSLLFVHVVIFQLPAAKDVKFYVGKEFEILITMAENSYQSVVDTVQLDGFAYSIVTGENQKNRKLDSRL